MSHTDRDLGFLQRNLPDAKTDRVTLWATQCDRLAGVGPAANPEALVALRIRLASRQPVGQSFQEAPGVLPLGPELRNPSIIIVHQPGLALVWRSQLVGVSVFFALQQPSAQTGRKCSNPCVLDSPQAQGSRPKQAEEESCF